MKVKAPLLISIIILSFLTGFSQFSISYDSIYLESDETDVLLGPLKIYNETDQDKTLVWEKIVHCVSDDWIQTISDENITYLPQTMTAEFILEAHDSSYNYVHFFTQDTFPGMGIVQIDFFEQGFSDDRHTCTFYWNTGTCTTSLKGSSLADVGIRVFPNPVIEELYIKGKQEGGTLEFYNHQGVLIMNIHQKRSQIINVSTLQPGPYYLVFKNRLGHLIETKPFIKL